MSKVNYFFGKYEEEIKKSYSKAVEEKIAERIWKKDFTVWSENPTEISNRLGWLDLPEEMKNSVAEINEFVSQVKNGQFENALLLGMGGSSLAPEVFSRIFGTEEGFLKLSVLDSTHPDKVNECLEKLPAEKTLYIVSTKSGGTIETISFLKFFYSYVAGKVGKDNAGNHFVAITDPGSGLEDYAKKLNFRKIFLNNPDIGGRFSALSMFGLVPAALIGVDAAKLLAETQAVTIESKLNDYSNSSLVIGTAMGALAELKIDKLTFIIPPALNAFGVWVEQLIAESTGKIGKGILPIEGEKILIPEKYKKDRVFVYLRLEGEKDFNEQVDALIKVGFPVIKVDLKSKYELCAEFFRWEFATAVAGYVLKVQPFDQPDVESAKIIAREMIKAYSKSGKVPQLPVTLSGEGMEVVSELKLTQIKSAVKEFIDAFLDREYGYVSIHAYLNDNTGTLEALQKLRTAIEEKYLTSTTIGIGPRFLHSTGQLHKGDRGNGIYIQLISKNLTDFKIPDEPLSENSYFTFGVLINAQALGDRQALINNGKKVLRIYISGDVKECISLLKENV